MSIKEIREQQNQLIKMINTTFDAIVQDVENFKQGSNKDKKYELTYPLTNTTGFKGKKPIAVIMNNKKIITPTWKKVVEEILKEVLKEEKMNLRIMALRDVILGRVRTRLSSSNEGMRSPIQLQDKLFIETHYDTETLMNLLLQILNDINYDYSHINVIIKNQEKDWL